LGGAEGERKSGRVGIGTFKMARECQICMAALR